MKYGNLGGKKVEEKIITFLEHVPFFLKEDGEKRKERTSMLGGEILNCT